METEDKGAEGRTHRRWVRAVIALLVVGTSATLLVAWRLGAFDPVFYNFKDETSAMLTDLTGGKKSALRAYNRASFAFQETASKDGFVDRADRLTETLGKFQGILGVDEIETLGSIRGKTARVEYQLRFERATTSGEVSYLRGADKEWRLLGYDIRVPDALAGTLEQVDAQEHRNDVPGEVIVLVDEIFADIAAGNAAQVYAQASTQFRESTSKERFLSRVQDISSELGSFKKRTAVIGAGLNANKRRARVHMKLTFEGGKTTGVLEFVKTKDEASSEVKGAEGGDRESWKLLRFGVVIPEPLLPQ